MRPFLSERRENGIESRLHLVYIYSIAWQITGKSPKFPKSKNLIALHNRFCFIIMEEDRY